MLGKISEIRDNIPISRRILVMVITVTISIAIVILTVSISISSINNRTVDANIIYTNNLVRLSDFIENIYSVIIKAHITSDNSSNEELIDNTLQIDLLEVNLVNFREKIESSQKEEYDKLVFECRNYIEIVKNIKSLELKGKYASANVLKNKEELESFIKLQKIIKSLQKSNIENLKKNNVQMMKLENTIFRRISMAGLLVSLFIFIVFLLVFYGLRKQLSRLMTNLGMLNRGQIPVEKLRVNKNEFGQMSSMVNSLSDNISDLNDFATALGKGNYTKEHSKISNDNLLGKALIGLRDNLNLRKEADTQRKKEEEIRNWINSGHALFVEILRQQSHDIHHLADDVIKNIVHYLSANQGGLFIINDDEIELIATFAYDRKKFVERKIKVGDGLIGTVAMERNTIYLDKIPENYIEIESGLGDATPSNLLIVPLNFEDDILGIVEIASFKKIKTHEIKFVEELGQSIASTLLSVKINEKTEQLLNDSRKKSKELALREIEAMGNMEKMAATQELAERREADLTGIISAVDNTLMKGEYELDGTLISVNDRHLQTFGYQLREIKGKNIEIFIPEKELEDFRKLWTSVISGNPRQVEVERKTKTGDTLWLVNQYTPVTNADGEISRVLYFAHDITRYKLKEQSLKDSKALAEYNKKSEALKNDLAQKQKDLEQIENKINALKSQQAELGDEFANSDVDKKYSDWLNSIE